MKWHFSQLAAQLGSPVTADVWITGAAIDSRQVRPGDLFVALAGERTDGHRYLDAARKAGAVAALVQKPQASPLPQLVVKDVRAAFAKIAACWRQRCQTVVIAVTGSNGKTTVKEMIAAMLRQVGTVVATQGNLNNELGVPLTLCRLEENTAFAVIEMGASHPGDIAVLTPMAQADIAVITTVSAAHLQGFGSLEGVARAKAEIYAGLRAQGVAVINQDLEYAAQWKQVLTDKKVVTFALHHQADIMALAVQQTVNSSEFKVRLKQDCLHIKLPLPGQHNIANALAAIAAVSTLDIPPQAIEAGLKNMRSVPHRLQFRPSIRESILIDDSYNANPGSFEQALNVLMTCPGRHWLVLGDFAELGEASQQVHAQMGNMARQAGVEKLLTVGAASRWTGQAFGTGASHFDSQDMLFETLSKELARDVTFLIKGSRSMQLDQLADRLATDGGH